MFSEGCFLVVVLSAITRNVYCMHRAASGEMYTHKAVLSEDAYEVFWKYDSSEITFEVEVATTGWVGFGLSPNGGMAGSDIVIGGVHDDGKSYFRDRHATANSEPTVDSSQDYILLHSSQLQDKTTLRFQRKMDTCDDNDMTINGNTFRIIWAYGVSDTVSYHSSSPFRRGVKSVLLLAATRSLPNMPSNTFMWDFVVNNVSVPAKDTSYWCKGFHVPRLTKKHHVIKYQPHITLGNEALVHHILIYACYGDVNTTGAHLFESDGCNLMPNNLQRGCLTTLFGWAVGGEAFYFPNNVGLPFGDDQQPKFLLLEIHYDNPTNRADWIDSSGFKLTLTPTLRRFDAGLLTIGHPANNAQAIPPGQLSFTTYSYCNSDCTKEGLAGTPNGVKIIAGLLHAHLLGRKMRLRHIRNGVELEPLYEDNNYDFNYQEMVVRRQQATFLPGDEMQIECQLSSQKKNTFTYGGLATNDEMCLAFLLYYPRTQLTYCGSMPPPFVPFLVEKGMNFTRDKNGGVKIVSGKYAGKYAAAVFENITWNKDNALLMESATKNSPYTSLCFAATKLLNATMKPFGTYRGPLHISVPYQYPGRQCDQLTTTTLDGSNVGVSAFEINILTSVVLACLVVVLA